MQPPSDPQINRQNPKEYFIYWNHDVPEVLWHKYSRRRIRIKKKDNINRYQGEERETYAEECRQVWKYRLEKLNYNPFELALSKLNAITERKETIEIVIKEKAAVIAAKATLTEAERRKRTPINKACDLWVESRMERTKNRNSVSTYRVTASWFKKYFEDMGAISTPVSELSRMDISSALMAAKKAKGWEPTTFNNEMDTLTNLFNWLELEEYVTVNPIRGKLQKVKTQKHKHRWYDRETLALVKAKLIEKKEFLVYHVMEFTYWTMIRSKTELMKLKAGDIDRTLKRIHFSADLDKTGTEAYRDYEPEFEAVLDIINFDAIPKNFYIFGKGGEPSEFKCHKDLFADRWRPIRTELGLSDDFTIYGLKHTRIVHLLMKGIDGYDISYKARHTDPKSTKQYQRDYDITLVNVYGAEDLKF